MPDPHYDHRQDVVLDRVDDSVVADADAQVAGSIFQSARARGPWVHRKLQDGPPNPSPHLRMHLAHLSFGSRQNLNGIGHVQPRSRMTCFQGMGSPPSARAASTAAMSSSSSSASIISSYRSGLTITAAGCPLRSRITASVCAVSTASVRFARKSVMLKVVIPKVYRTAT